MTAITNLKCEYLTNPLGIDTKQPRFSWVMESDERGQRQTAYRLTVKKGDKVVWATKKVRSDASSQIVYSGEALASFTRYTWSVTVYDKAGKELQSGEAFFETAMLRLAETTLPWIGLDPAKNPPHPLAHDPLGRPAPYLRKSFNLFKEVKSARAYVTALGVYELFVNGKKAAPWRLAPGWTDYNKQTQYQTYDITPLLRGGENVLGAMLGDGWYNGNICSVGRNQYGDYPLLLKGLFRIEFADGELLTLATDGSWKAASGPIVYSELQRGEIYDANLELTGWSEAGYDDSAWEPVISPNRRAGRMIAQIGQCVSVNREQMPVSCHKIADKTWIYDMGQNMVGVVSLKAKGPKNARIDLEFGEMLNDDGTVYLTNLRSAKQHDIYIKKSDEAEVFEPVFTFHGFRYVQITGIDEMALSDVVGKVIYSATEQTGFFECSSAMVNQLYSNILWGQRGNFVSVPTDCPQRDERMGWSGDTQVFARTGCYNMDTPLFYTKYMRDMSDALHPFGCYTDVVPYVEFPKQRSGIVGHGNTAWGDAGIILPYTLYLMYGDMRVIADNWEDMCLHMDFMKNTTKDYIRPAFGYGDWLSVGEETEQSAMNTAFFAYTADLMAKMAALLGKKEEETYYKKLFESVKHAFNNAFVEKNGRIKNYTQTIYVMALRFHLLSAANRKRAAKYLVENIMEKGGHLSTGFVGVSYLLPVLSEEGYNDVAYQLITNETYPSWGYSVVNGATTIWERWNSYTIEGGFGDVSMNSFNHYSLGSCGEWMYRYAGGIDVDEKDPAFRHVVIKPYVNKAFTYVKSSYQSIRGKIVSNWSLENGFTMDVTIPANTRATIYVPTKKGLEILEGNTPAAKAEGLKFKGCRDGFAVYEAASGTYHFHVSLV